MYVFAFDQWMRLNKKNFVLSSKDSKGVGVAAATSPSSQDDNHITSSTEALLNGKVNRFLYSRFNVHDPFITVNEVRFLLFPDPIRIDTAPQVHLSRCYGVSSHSNNGTSRPILRQ